MRNFLKEKYFVYTYEENFRRKGEPIMTNLSISESLSVKSMTSEVKGQQETKSAQGVLFQGNTQTSGVPTRQDVAKFNQYLKQPGISDAPKSVKELTANGFVKGDLMDMNGGVYYFNEITGDSVRICDFEKSYTYTHGRISHEQYDKKVYDGGMIKIKELDGSTTIYSYKNDSNGEKYLTSVTRYE